ncbi:MAG TPA: MEDS domain-containing protein [Pseudonocardiaceae bacterium]
MRLAGVAEVARGFGNHDHLCWSYEERDELRRRVTEFLDEGLAAGQQVWYVADGTVEELMGDLRGLGAVSRAAERGALRALPLDTVYRPGALTHPGEPVLAYRAATEAALAAGFTGLRVAAEGTSLIRTPEQLDTFARYEHLVDRYLVDHPVTGMCAYNRAELGEDVITQLACMHPVTNHDTVPFRVHATEHAEVGLRGEIDLTGEELFRWVLERVEFQPAGGKTVVDATGLDFIDHHGLLTLENHARNHDATVVLQTRRPVTARLIELLRLTRVRVELVG